MFSGKNEEDPRFLFKHSDKVCIFDCLDCLQEFKCQIRSIICTNINCISHHRHKTELKLYKALVEHFSEDDVIREFKQDWCKSKNNRYLPFDFLIKSLNLIIELDGPQHFNDISYFKSSSEDNIKNDIIKMYNATENGFSIIRIYQPEVYEDSYDWKNKLLQYIKSYDIPTVVYISNKKGIYYTHKEIFENVCRIKFAIDLFKKFFILLYKIKNKKNAKRRRRTFKRKRRTHRGITRRNFTWRRPYRWK